METEQPIILALETATLDSSVAITRGGRLDGEVLGLVSLSGNVTHSRRLLPVIDYLMSNLELRWNEIDGIGVSLGPGSFTGLRIGMAAAKGLSAAASCPLLGVSTLDVVAANCTSGRNICVVLDARKKEVYSALYKMDENGLTHCVIGPQVIPPEKLAEQLDEPSLVVGGGAMVYRERFISLLKENVSFAPAQLHSVSAAALGLLCGESYLRGEFLDINNATPVYIRKSDAELNLRKKREKLQAEGTAG